MKPILRIVRGIPGSGKSTFAKSLKAYHIALPIEVPEVYENEFRNNLTDRLKQQSVVISSVFYRNDQIDLYRKVALDAGAGFRVYRCTRGDGFTHNVPPETLAKMRLAWEPYRKEKVIK